MSWRYALIAEYRIIRIINKIVITLLIVKNFPAAVYDFLKLSHKSFIILKLYSGLKVKLRSNTVDSHEAVSVLSGQEYPYNLFNGELSPNALVLDIGAHIGSFTLYLKQKRPDLKIYCFEPAPDNFKILSENITINGFSDIKLFQVAVASQTGQKYLEKEKLASNAYKLGQSGKRVDCLDLDTFIKNEGIYEIDLIKMDCEGAEFEILTNFKNLKKVKSIILEYHRISVKFDDSYIVNLMRTNNFKLKNRRDLLRHNQGILYFERNI